MPCTSILKPFQSVSAASALVLMTGFSLAHLPRQGNATPAFKSAHVVSATDVPYPMQSIAIGTVVLEVTVSETGQVENVLPIREIDSLTEVATDSVKNWQFASASLDGKPIRSRTTVAVTFNPAAIPAANVPLPPLSPKAHSRDRTLPPQPIDVLGASFPQYPINSIASGTVVLRVTIDETGKVDKTVPVRRIPSLTSPAILALQEWKFQPAEFDGKPASASVALAFVFRQPLPAPSVRR
jgi:outer membrane biosynthesis protein TonB